MACLDHGGIVSTGYGPRSVFHSTYRPARRIGRMGRGRFQLLSKLICIICYFWLLKESFGLPKKKLEKPFNSIFKIFLLKQFFKIIISVFLPDSGDECIITHSPRNCCFRVVCSVCLSHLNSVFQILLSIVFSQNCLRYNGYVVVGLYSYNLLFPLWLFLHLKSSLAILYFHGISLPNKVYARIKTFLHICLRLMLLLRH